MLASMFYFLIFVCINNVVEAENSIGKVVTSKQKMNYAQWRLSDRRTMSHTIHAAKFEQTIIHQHVHFRWEIQSHAPAHVIMRLYPIDKSLVLYKAKEGRKQQA
jgi:hypothetical protein